MNLNLKGDPKKKNKPYAVVFFLVILAYLAFILGKSLYENYKFNKNVEELEKKVEVLEDRNQRLKNLVLYYKTDSFKEKEARQKLMMKKPGEHVVAVKDVEIAKEEKEEEKSESSNTKEERKDKKPNYQRWIRYIFG